MAKCNKIIKHLFLIFISLTMFFPFIWMFLNGLKTKDEIWATPPTLFPENPNWLNFKIAWESAPYGLYIFNSFYVSILIVLFQTISSLMFAYLFTQYNFKGKSLIFSIVLSTYMIPVVATYVPSYVFLSRINLLDTHAGLIMSSTVSVFGIFLFRQSFMQIPKEIIKAAKIEGANDWKILWKLMVPMIKPTIVAFGLISFIEQYNNYLWPSLVISSEEKYLISQGLQDFFSSEGAYGMDWSIIMASSSFAVLPLLVLFLFAQKYIISGLLGNSLKG
ncbi:carbohydrate ABC transporter permease [Fundicoccus culcitae]|uniref:Carbohydrate ABC transporter permease n=1 Tax=Fundicoccus culcitae TaxID=2969821 RepID=A0ABY5P5X6_9LACT|nr:carbohydrate ABC transporter permease [Fundicoccus culcitae]UUX33780.1 carbohydrate ABC transporter permease [Fundicoccus culcitae]